MLMLFMFTSDIHPRVSAAGGAEETGRRDAAAAEIAVGDTRRSSSRGTFGQRAGNAKDAAARFHRASRRRLHKAQDTARGDDGKVTCSHSGS